MKKLANIILIISIAAFAACEGMGGDASGTAPYTLSVDKDVIESDGKDAATLVITDAKGKVMSTAANLRRTSFYIEETGEWRSGMGSDAPDVFTSIIDGTYTISAMYDGVQCQNTVSVTSRNRKNYERFHKNVAIYRLTGTWCPYCPYMTEALDNVNAYTKDHSVILEFHNGDEYSLGYGNGMDMAAFLNSLFKSNAYPFCIYSMAEGSGKRTVNDIQNLVKAQLVANPARTGIKASSSVADGKLSVSAEVTASAAGRYDLGIAVLKDNCIPTATAYEDRYNDVVTTISGNFYGLSTEAFDLKADESKSLVKECALKSEDLRDYRVVLFTLTEANGSAIIDNAVDFKVGEGVEYKYND